jgi:Spy/CpxP family protein refolding chaperone
MKLKAIILAAALSAPVLLAQPGPGPRGPRGVANLDALTQVLELTDQQVTDLKAARQDFFANEVRPIMVQIHEKRQTLRDEMQKESPNASIIGQLQVEIAELGNQIKAKHAAQVEQLRSMLTDPQKAKLAELQQAAELIPAIHQAQALSLLDAPQGGFGAGPGFGPGMGFGPMRGMARRGMRAPATQ